MKSKTKNTKVPKSAKTRLTDLTPKKDAVGGKYGLGGGPAGTPPIAVPPNANPLSSSKKRVNQ
jgi:hypothetical protein